jgi:hypothetical protein
MTCQLLISSSTYFVVVLLLTEVYIEMMQEGLNIKCSFQDFVTVYKMCIDLMHTDDHCNESLEVENTGEVNEESGFRL